MEEETQLSKKIISNEDGGGGGGEDEEFYEKIEAPKFVDFTVSDPHHPDDRYWFCSRVGCDLKHEEEVDPEAIYKNFVLRVMAARSPNIRLRKALNRKAPSTTRKCPLSAPAKPSKSRFAVISSIPQKMVDAQGKVKPIPKLSSTPHHKAKQVAAKYLTTPRNKKCLPNPNSFHSVQNPKPTTVEVPKNRMVVKALVFHSPKKGICVKTSSELRTPLSKICEGMKKLDINSQRKRVLGYSNKSSKDIRRNPNKPLPLDPSGRRLNACKDKSRPKDSVHRQNFRDQEAKSLRCMKSKNKGNNKHCSSMSKEMVENDSSDMEIDVKSRDGSTIPSSRISKHNELEEHLTNVQTLGNFDSTDSTQEEAINSMEAATATENSDAVSSDDSKEAPSSAENSDALLSDQSRGEMNSQSNSDERDLEENGLPKVQAPNGEGDEGSEGNEQEKKTKSISEQPLSTKDHPAEYQTPEVAGHESETMDSDDKENASASDDNRNFDHNNNHHCRRKNLGKQETCENTKKVALMVEKNLKEGLTSTGASAQEMKYRKPKTTYPKPFRLRTDERGILKEANLERKNHFLAPQKEVAIASRFPSGNSQRRHGSNIQRNESCLEQHKFNNDTHEGSEKEQEENIQNGEYQQKSTAGLRISKGQVQPKIATVRRQRYSALTHQQPIPAISQLEDGKDSLKRTRSSSLQRQLIRHQRVASTKKATICRMTPGQQLGVIKETSSTISGKLSESCTPPATKAIASRSSSRGRRPTTIPKEPNFHNIHVPKSCARKAT